MIRIITSLVAALTVASIHSQTTLRETPKLVIGITIDQLRGDYLELFQHSFSEKGFKRLLNEGMVYQNMTFDYPNLNSAAAIATIYTGTSPFYHGITNEKKYVPDRNTEVSIFEDDSFLGNYTKEKLSPKNLHAGTIADELKRASLGQSEVHSFAPNSYQAIITAGQLANGAYWVEDFTGKWATTTYYKDFNRAVDIENRTNTYSNQTSSLVWQPSLSSDRYNVFPYGNSNNIFSHQFNSGNPYALLKKSPFVNENITKTAIKLLEQSRLGKTSSPSFLALTYYAGNYPESVDGDYSLEIQDTYTRLDENIASLLEYVEKHIGLQNTVVFLTSTGYYNSQYINQPDLQLSNGTFYSNRCEALLNMYLMALYGKEQWVEKYYNQQIYLNRKLIEDKGLSLEEIQNKAAEFVVQFSGVQDAVTLTQLLTGKAASNMEIYRDALNKELSGDVILEIQPGFQILDETDKTPIKKIQREIAVVCPVIFWGGGIKAEKIKKTVKATQIAPTVSQILRIRSPNAAKDLPLSEFF